MDSHQEPGYQRQADTVKNVEAKQRRFADETTAQQGKTRVTLIIDEGDITQFQKSRTRTLVSSERRRASHIAAHSDRPDGELVPRQQIAGKAQQQRQNQQDDADSPVEFSRRLVTPRQENAVHVQPDRDNHGMGAPAMHLAQDAQGCHIAQ